MISTYGSPSRLGAASSTPANGYYVDRDGQYVYKYAGGTITIVHEPGASAFIAKQVVPGTGPYASIYNQIASGQATYVGVNAPRLQGGVPVAAAQSATANTGVRGQTNLTDGQQVQTGDGTPAWLQTVGTLATTLMPFVSLGVDAVGAGAGSTLAKLQQQLADKQAKLARETNPGRRAKLQTEISSLQAQIASYQQAVGDDSGVQDTYVAQTQQIVSKSAVPWTTLALLLGGVTVVGGVLYAASSKSA